MKADKTSDRYFDPFPARLRELIGDRGVTQQALADAIGVRRQTVSAYSDGSADPTLPKIQAMADYFDVSIDYLVGKDACATPDNEGIHTMLGLSDASIEKLKALNDQGKPGAIAELPYGPFVIEAIDILLAYKKGVEALVNIYAFMDMFHGRVYSQDGEPIDMIDLYSAKGVGLAHVDLQYMEGAVLLMVSKELQNVKEELRKHVNQEDSE